MPIEFEDVTADITRATRTETGEVWESTKTEFGYLGDIPCRRFAMKGDPNTYFDPDTRIIQRVDLGNGWIKYWVVSSEHTRSSEVDSVRVYNHFSDRKDQVNGS
jgi:hypothetical protein